VGHETDDRVDRIILAYLEEVDAGRSPDRAALLARHPDLADELAEFFADQDRLAPLARPPKGPSTTSDDLSPPPADDGALPDAVGGYRPIRLLGEGGMGRVYEAEGPGGERVALKLLSPAVADSPTALERFRLEGRLASRLAHPRCVFVLKADEDAGRPYIVMELMSGVTLKDLVEGAGPLAPADAVARTLDVIDGLEEAHRAGVIHRDVKPANCYLDAGGRAKVGDFGLSRSLAVASHLTRVGGFVGTPLFASPEQLKGEPLDPRTDVYSVAATLYYLFTGQAPFQHADAATVIARVVSEAVMPPRALRPDLSPALEQVVLRGLERQRERRYQSLAEFREALLPLLPGQMTIAGLGLRAGAYFLDAIPFTVLGEAVGLSFASPDMTVSVIASFVFVVPFVLYFWLSEGLWGCSVGKWLLRLRVTRADGLERPGLGRALLRTAVFVATGGLLTTLFFTLVLRDVHLLTLSLACLAGTVVSLAARFGTMRARNGYRGLHELLSGTRVVELPPAGGAGGLVPGRLPEAERPARRDADVPERVGDFRVRGVLRRDRAGALLLGEDPALGRAVWVWLRPAGEGVLAPERKELGRPARLRWLGGGVEGGRQWDAFAAPGGAPLPAWVTANGPLPWPTARLVLEQLTEELHAAGADGTPGASLGVDQVWMDALGRVHLIDMPPSPLGGAADGDGSGLAFLGQVATRALGGCPPPRPLPLHARRLLARLGGAEEPYVGLDELAEDLAATRRRPAEVTPALRAYHLGISFCLLVGAVLVMLLWSRNGGMVHVVALDRAMIEGEVLLHVLADEELTPGLMAELPPDDPLRADPAGQAELVRSQRSRDWQELEARCASLGWLESLCDFIPHVRRRRELREADETLEVHRRPGEAFAVEVTVPELSPLDWDGTMTADRLKEVAARARGEDPAGSPEQRLRGALVALAVPLTLLPAGLLLSALAWRGGLSLRLAGLALVRGSGRDALRMQCAWRAAVVWVPVLAVLLPVIWIDLYRPDLVWAAPLMQGLAVLLLVTHGVLALRFPRRAPPDWLAGTHLVPR
jgi:hypothetical protein